MRYAEIVECLRERDEFWFHGFVNKGADLLSLSANGEIANHSFRSCNKCISILTHDSICVSVADKIGCLYFAFARCLDDWDAQRSNEFLRFSNHRIVQPVRSRLVS